jgi:hypothetical protein
MHLRARPSAISLIIPRAMMQAIWTFLILSIIDFIFCLFSIIAISRSTLESTSVAGAIHD